MSAVIRLPDRLYKRLALRSQQIKSTPEKVVVNLLQRYLDEPDDRWQAEFRALIERVQERTAAFSSAEIEADITLAAAEARELYRARRPA
jgi:predicted DNA-binding protein